jgi:hypothetical protein
VPAPSSGSLDQATDRSRNTNRNNCDPHEIAIAETLDSYQGGFRIGFQILPWLIKEGKDYKKIHTAADVFRTSAALSGDRGIL